MLLHLISTLPFFSFSGGILRKRLNLHQPSRFLISSRISRSFVGLSKHNRRDFIAQRVKALSRNSWEIVQLIKMITTQWLPAAGFFAVCFYSGLWGQRSWRGLPLCLPGCLNKWHSIPWGLFFLMILLPGQKRGEGDRQGGKEVLDYVQMEEKISTRLYHHGCKEGCSRNIPLLLWVFYLFIFCLCIYIVFFYSRVYCFAGFLGIKFVASSFETSF